MAKTNQPLCGLCGRPGQSYVLDVIDGHGHWMRSEERVLCADHARSGPIYKLEGNLLTEAHLRKQH